MESAEDEKNDFLSFDATFLAEVEGDCDKAQELDENDEEKKLRNKVYNSKKPKWWKNLCGKATKSQKRAMDFVFPTNRCPSVPYGTYIDWAQLFPKENDIWLELGFGRGENLLALAHRMQNEPISFVGAEIHKPGVGTLCQKIQKGIQEKQFWTDYITYSPHLDPNASDSGATLGADDTGNAESTSDMPYQNLRIYHGDGVKLLPSISTSSISVVLVTFPDPFPKSQQSQWRLIQTHTVLEIHRILRQGGIFYLATDHVGYNGWSHGVMDEVNQKHEYFSKVDPCPSRLQWLPAISTYEQKGWNEGRYTMLTCWKSLPSPGEK